MPHPQLHQVGLKWAARWPVVMERERMECVSAYFYESGLYWVDSIFEFDDAFVVIFPHGHYKNRWEKRNTHTLTQLKL